MSNNDLPVNTSEDFLAEAEVMDLSSINGESFLVGVSQGDRNKCKFLSSTVHGPYSFYEMCEEVGVMWREHQHHAKVTILTKERNKAPKFLDENTTEYIEAHYADIITEGLLGGAFDEVKEYTCKAGVVEADDTDDPRKAEKKEDNDNVV
jgi:hypothetical protein